MERKVVKENDEIDLLRLIHVIWENRKSVIKTTFLFVLLGLIIALTSKVEYEAYAKLLPESEDSGIPDLGGLGGLAGFAGFDLSSFSSSDQGISPELYPEIIKSTPFLDKLINVPIYFEKLDTTLTSFYYFKEEDRPSLLQLVMSYTIGLPGKLKKAIQGNEQHLLNDLGAKRYTKEEWEIIENFSDRLFVEFDEETGTISVKSEIPDAVAAAQISQKMVDELTKYVIKYKTEKSERNLEFIEEQFSASKLEYQEKQSIVAQFSNQNKNVTNALIDAEYERLKNEMNIAFEVYKGLASQLEQAKIQVNQNTPVFTILEPIRIPEEKSKPKRALIIIAFTFSGILCSIAYIYFTNNF